MPENQQTERCGTCRHFDGNREARDDAWAGRCRRHAPVNIKDSVHRWPVVTLGESCGDWAGAAGSCSTVADGVDWAKLEARLHPAAVMQLRKTLKWLEKQRATDGVSSWHSGPYGATSWAVKSAADDPKVKTILLKFDSPGGYVDGVAEAADEIARAARRKRVVAQVDGLAASAAYWMASEKPPATDETPNQP